MSMVCKVCFKKFEIDDLDYEFYKKISVPVPAKCPTCRLVRRLLERNTRQLYKRKCDFSGKDIISQYHPDQPFPVYHYDVWYGDGWDALKCGQDIDFSKPFFEQFKTLKNKVPHMSAFVVGGTLENSDYTNCTGYLKNCYLIFEADYNEDCCYSNRIYHSKNLVDCLGMYDSELCYECLDSRNCFNLGYSNDCENCSDSLFLNNCKACKNCLGCINLRHKSFCVFNKQYSESEYREEIKKYDFETLRGIKEFWHKVTEFFNTQPHKNLQQDHNENCLVDYVYDSKNAYYCFDCKDLEDCRYCARVAMTVKSCMDYSGWGDKSELVYESAACGNNAYNLKFCTTCASNNSNLEYCDQCTGCGDCFGCIGLKRKKYCVLNKQYAESEYFVVKNRLVKHMMETKEYGEFFPVELAPFGYNESIAMEYFPISKDEVLKMGFKWTDREKAYKSQGFKVPEKIRDVNDSILNEVLACNRCGMNFKITGMELKFYRQFGVPIPENCTNCRHNERFAMRNPKCFYDRKCGKCGQSIKTTFPPETICPVYCEKCYLKEVL